VKELLKSKTISEENHSKSEKSLGNKKWFVIFLILFEFGFHIAWYGSMDKDVGISTYSFNPGLDLSGIFIAAVVLPIASQMFTSMRAIGRIQHTIKNQFMISVFSFDKRGGLKPIGDLLLLLAIVYFVGISVVFFLYPDIFKIYFGFAFVAFGGMIFLVPQISLHHILLNKKNEYLNRVQKKISHYSHKILETDSNSSNPDELEDYSNSLDKYKEVRDEINLMRVWPSDLNTVYKFISSLPIPTIPIIGNEVFREGFSPEILEAISQLMN